MILSCEGTKQSFEEEKSLYDACDALFDITADIDNIATALDRERRHFRASHPILVSLPGRQCHRPMEKLLSDVAFNYMLIDWHSRFTNPHSQSAFPHHNVADEYTSNCASLL